MASTYLRAALAAAAGATLLTMSTSGYTAWQSAAAPAPPGASLEAGAVTVRLTTPGEAPRDVDLQAGVRARVGDTVTVEVPVTVHTGGAPSSVLTVDVPPATGDKALAAELAATGPRVEVTPLDGGPNLTALPGRSGAHLVSSAADGHSYAVRWSTSTRATRDGKAPGARNGWGSGPSSLQGASVGARPLTVTLTPATGSSTSPASTSPESTPPASTPSASTPPASVPSPSVATIGPSPNGARR